MTSLLTALRYRLEYGVFRLLGAFLAALPVEMASTLSGAAWRAVAPLFNRHRRALAHLALAFPEKGRSERERIARDMWENLGRTFAESFHIAEFIAGNRIFVSDPAGAEALRAVSANGVFCSPHLGNWEITIIAALRLGYKPAGVYQRIKNPLVDAYVTHVRLPLYPGGLHVKGAAAAKHLLRYAKNGGSLAMLADLRENRSISVPFFGHAAPSTTFPALVARTLNLPLVAAASIRQRGSRFRVDHEEIAVQVTADRDADIAAATAALQASFERLIRAHPEQWMWAHRRWG